jgi:hypothetical protein
MKQFIFALFMNISLPTFSQVTLRVQGGVEFGGMTTNENYGLGDRIGFRDSIIWTDKKSLTYFAGHRTDFQMEAILNKYAVYRHDTIVDYLFKEKQQIVEFIEALNERPVHPSKDFQLKKHTVYIACTDICSGRVCPIIYIFQRKEEYWHLWSTSRNVTGSVDNVEFFDGATFVINEHASKGNGVSIGSFLNINDKGKTPINRDGEFDPTLDHLYMHEYGHYIQSQEYGWGYLVSVGVPSLFGAKNSKSLGGDELNPYGLTTHNIKWYELRANKKASKYFGEKYGVLWNSNRYPRDRTEIDPRLLRTAEIQLYNRWYRKSIWERVEYSKQKTKL